MSSGEILAFVILLDSVGVGEIFCIDVFLNQFFNWYTLQTKTIRFCLTNESNAYLTAFITKALNYTLYVVVQCTFPTQISLWANTNVEITRDINRGLEDEIIITSYIKLTTALLLWLNSNP